MRLGKGTANHHSVRSAGERLAHIAALAHSSISQDRNVTGSFLEIIITSSRTVHGCCYLRNAKAQHTAGSAGGTGSDTNENSRRAALHDFIGNFVPDRIPNDDRNLHLSAEFLKIERLYSDEICLTVET